MFKDFGAGPGSAPRDDVMLADALARMIAALRLLDSGGATPDVGAHLDLAIHRLKNQLDETG